MPLTAVEISGLTDDASSALQALQDDLGRDNVVGARVRFPRGFIRTVTEIRKGLPNLGTEVQRRNACYALMTIDVFRWLVVRTDLSSTALSMIVKEGICTLGAICEWLTKEATRGHGSNRPYMVRTGRLVGLGLISATLKQELDWLWDIRCNQHLHEVTTLEHEMYARADYNRALKAYALLRDALVNQHGHV